jgi:aryl-alcohol dehydrogenase-like predicted oxidoreductase
MTNEPLPKRRLGDLVVSAMGFGCMSLSSTYGQSDDNESVRALQAAVDLEITFFDTADLYGDGHNERLVGKALGAVRNNVVIATKFGFVRDAAGQLTVNTRPEYLRLAIDRSLERLGVDVIDLYYAHRVGKDVPIEETVGAMAELVAAGKVRYLGLSEAAAATVRRAHAVHPIAAVQSECSLTTRQHVSDLLPTLRELGIGFVPYSPLGRGILGARVGETFEPGDFRPLLPRFDEHRLAHNRSVAAQLIPLAERQSATPAQLALAWVLALGDDVVPIPGTRSAERVAENLGALRVNATPDLLATLEHITDDISGDRYPDFLDALIDH